MPKAVRRKSRVLGIDLTLIPYHGQPALDPKEIFRGEPKSGTTHFHAYASAVVLHKGHRYTLALTHVEYGDSMKEVVQRLLAIVRRRCVKIRFLLLDKGFFSVEVMHLFSSCRPRFHYSRGGAGPKAQGSLRRPRADYVPCRRKRTVTIATHSLRYKPRRKRKTACE